MRCLHPCCQVMVTMDKVLVQLLRAYLADDNLDTATLQACYADFNRITKAETGCTVAEGNISVLWEQFISCTQSYAQQFCHQPSPTTVEGLRVMAEQLTREPYWRPSRPVSPHHLALRQQDQTVLADIAQQATHAGTIEALIWNRDFAQSVVHLINTAQQRVLVSTGIFAGGTSSDLYRMVKSVCDAAQRCVEVKLLIGQLGGGKTGVKGLNKLQSADVPCRYPAQGRDLHANVIMIDHEILCLGSHNWTAGALFRNEELSVVIRSPDAVIQQVQQFMVEWQQGVAI